MDHFLLIESILVQVVYKITYTKKDQHAEIGVELDTVVLVPVF